MFILLIILAVFGVGLTGGVPMHQVRRPSFEKSEDSEQEIDEITKESEINELKP